MGGEELAGHVLVLRSGELTSTERSHGGQRDALGSSIPRMMVVAGKSTRLTSGGGGIRPVQEGIVFYYHTGEELEDQRKN